MTSPILRVLVRRPLRAAALTTVLLAPLALAGTGLGTPSAAPSEVPAAVTAEVAPAAAATYRPSVPFVSRPLNPAVARDLRNFTPRRRGTDFNAPCYTPVLATHPGTALVSRSTWGGPATVRIATSPGSLLTVYGYMRRTTVVTGQLIQSGQQIGVVGHEGTAKRCSLGLRVHTNRTVLNPTLWLARTVGRATPSAGLYGDSGINVATFNLLGASHTGTGGNKASWPNYDARLPKQLAMIEAAKADVVGLQEFQPKQRALFLKLAGSSWGVYPSTTTADPENSIIYRLSKFELVESGTFAVPYFNGRERQMPWVLLRDKVTDRTAYVINVHNPASTSRYPNQGRWRAEALRRERQLIIDLRANARPVFLTGDFNDRQKAFCAITTGKLAITPDSLPSMECAYPSRYYWVDWIFAAGQTRFTTLSVDTSTRQKRLSDHPLVVARAHLAD